MAPDSSTATKSSHKPGDGSKTEKHTASDNAQTRRLSSFHDDMEWAKVNNDESPINERWSKVQMDKHSTQRMLRDASRPSLFAGRSNEKDVEILDRLGKLIMEPSDDELSIADFSFEESSSLGDLERVKHSCRGCDEWELVSDVWDVEQERDHDSKKTSTRRIISSEFFS